MKGSRHISVKSYLGISEFALYRPYISEIQMLMYNCVVRPARRQSDQLISISTDGVFIRSSKYHANIYNIDIKNNTSYSGDLYIDGYDEIWD